MLPLSVAVSNLKQSDGNWNYSFSLPALLR